MTAICWIQCPHQSAVENTTRHNCAAFITGAIVHGHIVKVYVSLILSST